MNPFNRLGRIVAMVLSLIVVAPMPNMASAQVPGGTTPVVAGAVPTNTVYPAITGVARVPNTLTASRGTWGNAPTTFANSWYRCTTVTAKTTSKPASCTLVDGQTGSSYVLGSNDVGKFIVAAVTASNASGPLTRWSASTAAVIAQYLPPKNTVVPVVSGNKAVSQTLTVTNGTWTESPASYTFKWFRCTSSQAAANAKPAACTEIAGQTSSTYTLVTGDAAKFMVASVTATNLGGSIPKWSASTAAIAALLRPANTAVPLVSGTPINSVVLSATTGTWTNYPTAYSYQWFRCTARKTAAANTIHAGCTNIAGATSSTYELDIADVARFVGVAVTATNAIGSTTKWSISSARVAALPAPTNAVTPTVAGTAQVSRVLTLSNGTWNYRPTAYSYKWYACTTAKAADSKPPKRCVEISGQTARTLQLRPDQVGEFVVGSVTATNSTGARTHYSASMRLAVSLESFAPDAFLAPVLSGTNQLGSALTISDGLWEGFPAPSLSKSWHLCSTQVLGLPHSSTDCREIVSGIVSVAAGFKFSCAVSGFGQLACWGNNNFGQLGIGTLGERTNPTLVAVGGAVSLADAGGDHACAVTVLSGLYCWGKNNKGQIGNGTISDSLLPVELQIEDVIEVSAGWQHSCAIDSAGYAYCWGNNENGQLGLGDRVNRTSPTRVAGIANVVSISAGYDHTCAVLSSGGVKCWGLNANGHLGDGTTVNRLSPVTVSGVTNALQVAAAWTTSCAVLSSGLVKCWGYNAEGRIGDGTTVQRTSPVSVVGITSATSVSMFDSHACALLHDGSAKCWGKNVDGSLGSGSTSSSSTPVAAANGKRYSQVTGGYTHTCGVSMQGGLDCWGTNDFGQLGDGSKASSLGGTSVTLDALDFIRLTIHEEMLGQYLYGRVTASNLAGSASGYTSPIVLTR